MRQRALFSIITDENNSFSFTTPGHWSSRGGAESIYKLQKLLEPESQNDIEFHVKEVKQRGNQTKIVHKDYIIILRWYSQKRENWRVKNVEYNDLEDMVLRMRLTYTEIEKILDVKYFPTSCVGFTLPPG